MATRTAVGGKLAALSALRVRTLVLALGEGASPPWWRTNLLGDAGRRFCQRLFPRTALPAALHSVGKAACEAHDEAIGQRAVHHLFRLPDATEREMRMFFEDSGDPESLASLLGTRNEMMDRLQELGVQVKPEGFGPVRIGLAPVLAHAETYRRMAGLYFAGFKAETKVFPYAEVSA